MAQLSARIDDANFKAQALKYQQLTGKTFKEVLNKQTLALCKRLSKTTNPFGNTGAGKKIGDKAVTGDIRKVYKTEGTVYGLIKKAKIQKKPSRSVKTGRFKKSKNRASRVADAWYSAYKKGNHSEAERILHKLKIEGYYSTNVGNFDGGSAHQDARHGARQRVSANQFPKLVTDASDIQRYIDKRKSWVGLAKSGWAYCAGLLGNSSGIAGWITNADHGKSVGSVKFKGGSMDGSYQVENKVDYAVPSALSQGGFKGAVDDARNNMYQFFVKANDYLINKAGMK